MYRAVRSDPRWRYPVGEGAKRVRAGRSGRRVRSAGSRFLAREYLRSRGSRDTCDMHCEHLGLRGREMAFMALEEPAVLVLLVGHDAGTAEPHLGEFFLWGSSATLSSGPQACQQSRDSRCSRRRTTAPDWNSDSRELSIIEDSTSIASSRESILRRIGWRRGTARNVVRRTLLQSLPEMHASATALLSSFLVAAKQTMSFWNR